MPGALADFRPILMALQSANVRFILPVHVASIPDLLAMKRAANRPKDQAHILELLELQKLLDSETSSETS